MFPSYATKFKHCKMAPKPSIPISNFPVHATLVVLSSLILKTTAIMTFPEEGVYSLFPHEDLRTGRRTIRFEDSSREPTPVRDRYQDSRPPPPPLDLGRDDLRPAPTPGPSREPFIVDILRPTSQGLRNLKPDRPNVFRDRERDRLFFSNRTPRVQFHDDERRVYGYGKRYYHDELPPPVDEPSRETNLIRPSPIDYHRDEADRRYLPNTYSYLPEAKLPPGANRDNSEERTRIHIFHPGQPRRNGYHGYRHPDGPAKVDVPGSGAFLNHDEYLEFHTKLALDTLNKEKKKLEEAQKKFASTRPPRPMMKVGGLIPPPNFSKEVTVIQEDHTSGEGSSCEDHSHNKGTGSTFKPLGTASQGNGGYQGNGEKKFLFTTSTATSLSSDGNKNGVSSTTPSYIIERGSTESSQGGGKDTDKRLLTPSTSEASVSTSTETGFLPIVPFHLQGIRQVTIYLNEALKQSHCS
ncbi:unnamed protein product [Allacma fusca]|uniref:Uncharacterized protein n=1 Tax=Allacma fusca TaxID=39272 RepID=A0A8J2LA05_9HEXA|nr:unnamed protein product [Allacma fusca]